MSAVVARFEIDARSDAQTLPRLINFFAQRSLTPSFVQAEMKGSTTYVVIEQLSVDPAHALIIAEKMRACVLVESVALKVARRIGGSQAEG